MPPEYRTRFAPSPTGLLHLGHAFSALTAWDRAKAADGTFLLRIEDIDTPRCTKQFEAAIYRDLAWLGVTWPQPALRQSDRKTAYAATLNTLIDMDLCYPCRCRRADIHAALTAPQEGAAPLGPDGPVYPGTCRTRPMRDAAPGDAIRLNMTRAIAALGPLDGLSFTETGPRAAIYPIDGPGLIQSTGDVVLARRDIGTSYHIAVVTDDAAQRITEVVRGEDLFATTPLHVVLQALLQLPTPTYHHHRLIRDEADKRLAKRDDARALATFRAAGITPKDIRTLTGLT